jgi:hypothetical protein
MSRNASGTYTLVAGNPVVTATVISSAWANNTLTDIATALTDSLDRNGKGAMLAALKLVSGSAAAPGLCFDSANNAGLSLLAAAGDVPAGFGLSYAGVEVARVATGQFYVSAGKITGVAGNTSTTTSLAIQTSVTNGPTYVNIMPNGTGTNSALRLLSSSNVASTDSCPMLYGSSSGATAGLSLYPARTDGGAAGGLAFAIFYSPARACFSTDTGANVLVGTDQILPNSTSGFTYMQTVTSSPQAGGATPLASIARSAQIVESGATPKLWFYNNGSWYYATLTLSP